MSQVRGDLIAARHLIEDPEDWCHGWGTEDGRRRCALHALINVTAWTGRFYAARNALHSGGALGGCSIGLFNDTHTHAEVLAAFDKAIAETK